MSEFQFDVKKMGVAGALFDLEKLNENYIMIYNFALTKINNGNVHKVNEYTTEVGFLYGAVNNVYHMLGNAGDYVKNLVYFHRSSTSTTHSGVKTTSAYIVDDSLVFDGSTLTVNVKGNLSVNDVDVVDFKLSLTYSKN